jgi:hypothetical protein
MILLEGFLVRLKIDITKNPSRRIINVTWMSKRMGLYADPQHKKYLINFGLYFVIPAVVRP